MMIGSNNTINMTYNALTATNKAIEKTARALSTGQRAATAADDAAGFAIGAGLSAQVAGVDRAIRNTQDGISLLQTAEGGLNQINSMLQRMRELTVQAANDTLTSQDREYMQLEIDELRNNIDNVAKNTTFNTKRLLDGSSAANWTSDNDTTKLRVTGAVTEFDQFGQKKTAAGNYRIEIRAKAGQGQIQKTSIMDLTIAEEYTRTETLTDSDGNIITDDNGDPVEILIKDTQIREATLSEMRTFTNPSGVSMFNSPQRITIAQGDGKTTTVTLYGLDTLSDVRKKINDAIADGLGHAAYTDNKNSFCTIADGTTGTSEAVRDTAQAYRTIYRREYDEDTGTFGQLILDDYGQPQELTPSDYTEYCTDEDGEFDSDKFKALMDSRLAGNTTTATLLIRSGIAGSAGELTFSSDNQDLISALGLTTIQEAADNVFVGSVYDSHTGKVINNNVNAEGNTLNGVISQNISIDFDPMANVKASWDEGSKRYMFSNEASAYVTTIHIMDKSTAFQVGQNVGEDMYMNIGDMRAAALGLNEINVLTREDASKSITLLDAAIHQVGSQRSKVGAYQNELEYNANSLRQTSLHMQESESRIKDTDMAREYMEFVKLQILSSTGNSMLSQANQNSQAIMNIIGQ